MKYKDYYAILGVEARCGGRRHQDRLSPARAQVSPRRVQGKGRRGEVQGDGRGLRNAQGSGEARRLRPARQPRAGPGIPAAARLGPAVRARARAASKTSTSRACSPDLAGGRDAAARAARTTRWPAATTRPSCAFPSCRRSTARKSISSCRRSNGARTAARGACRIASRRAFRAASPTAKSCASPARAAKASTAGPDGDLYLDIEVAEHPLYRVAGKDVYVDLPLAPWEAVLGTSVKLPTPAGAVTLKVPPGTRAGQQLRLSGRGMTRGSGAAGHLHAVVRIEVPTGRGRPAEGALQGARRRSPNFDPRAHFEQEAAR